MKFKLFLIISFIALSLSSCIKDEALNSEADILSFNLPNDVMYGEPQISNKEIILFIKQGVDVFELIYIKNTKENKR